MEIGVAVGRRKTECGVIEAHTQKPADQEESGHPPAIRRQDRSADGKRQHPSDCNEILKGRARRPVGDGGIGESH